VTIYERFEKLSDTDMAKSTRRRLLGRAAKASLGFAVVAAGLSRAGKAAAAKSGIGCCFLAYQNQCPNCTGHGYDCGAGCTRWAWYCVDSAHHVWICGECYSSGNCNTGCSCGAVALSVTNQPLLHPLAGH
jgi:hypothetical protein